MKAFILITISLVSVWAHSRPFENDVYSEDANENLSSSLIEREPATPPESRNRLEELFIWKVSEDLKLSVMEEKSFSELLRDINKRKIELNDNLQNTLRAMQDSKTSKEKDKALADYKKKLKSYNAISIDEIDKVQKIFGPEKTAQYLLIKSDLTSRVKTLLASPDKSKPEKSEKIPAPKIIEEQN